MLKETVNEQSPESSQELTIQIPHKLAMRIEAYAKETGADITGVVIEAVDVFLREKKGS